jgi:ecotin
VTDGVNRYQLTGSLEPRNLEGWGYTYYTFTGPAQTISTLMAPPEGTPAVEAFVSAAPLLVRYNSRLPIVVYVPSGLQVRYRVWSAGDETLDAERL